MIRLTNNQARLLAAVALAHPEVDARELLRLRQEGTISYDVYNALLDPETGGFPVVDISDIIDLLKAASRRDSTGHKEVLDIVIETIKQPFAGNMMSTEWLSMLRNKLLSKEEENERIKAASAILKCTTCGHEFDADGEEAIIVHDGFALTLQCRTCRKPRFTSCKTRGCQESVEWNYNKTGFCPGCKEKEAAKRAEMKAKFMPYAAAYLGGPEE